MSIMVRFLIEIGVLSFSMSRLQFTNSTDSERRSDLGSIVNYGLHPLSLKIVDLCCNAIEQVKHVYFFTAFHAFGNHCHWVKNNTCAREANSRSDFVLFLYGDGPVNSFVSG